MLKYFLCFYLQNHAPSPVTNKCWPYGYFVVNKKDKKLIKRVLRKITRKKNIHYLSILLSLLVSVWVKRFSVSHMRHCEIKVIKLCQVKKKLIALAWCWVTIIIWCQINSEIPCSYAKYNVKDKKNCINNESGFKIYHFMVQFFL